MDLIRGENLFHSLHVDHELSNDLAAGKTRGQTSKEEEERAKGKGRQWDGRKSPVSFRL